MVNFGCCKTRPFPPNYYICKNCLKIFHRSCVQQNKNKYNFLKDFQITCCSNDLDIIANDEKSLLELTINDLTQNSEMQNSYIEKLKQEQKILIEEVTQREEDQNEQIRYYQERIKVQKSEIADMRNTIDERDKKSRQTISTQTSITTNNKENGFCARRFKQSSKISTPSQKSKSKSEKASTINQSHFKSLNHRLYPDDSLAAEINEGTAGTTTSSVPSEAEETSKTKLKKMAFSIPKESFSGVSPSDSSFLGEKIGQ
ncbi:hypothetical protein JTB14_035033 [Gonioctena quinquepunctata]|nr:hypothetical protein JTB14_035033 [Gonioctena quinquepunctata]